MATNKVTVVEGIPLTALALEDSARDFEIIREQLTDAGYTLDISRVEQRDAFAASLRGNRYDIILADFSLPGFDAFGALRLRNEICPEVPFICVSGSIGEETAIELMKLGAVDYVFKERPKRLPLAIKRALEEAKKRKLLRKTQEELLANFSLLRIAGHIAKLGGWGVDLHTHRVTWSEEVADIHEMPHGYAPEGAEKNRFYAPEWQQKINRVFTDCAEKGVPYDEEMEVITATGKRIWVRTLGEAVTNEAGKVIRVEGAVQDITERRQRTEDLREANRQLFLSQKATLDTLADLKAENQTRRAKEAELQRVTMAIEQAGEVVFITDAGGTIQYVNPAFETVTGYSRREAHGQNPRMLKSGRQDQAFYRDLWETITSGRVWKGRLVNKRKDGTLYIDETTISPVFDETGGIIHYVAVKRDITRQQELAEQLEQAQKMESVGRLAGGVAHDYNNMLSVIIGYTEMAMAKLATSDPLYADLKEVYNAAKRSSEITRQLLAFARKQTISPVVLDLNESLEGVLKMLRRLIGEDIDLSWQPGPDLGPVKMDPAQLDQILANLCVNAMDAIKGVGKITIETANVTFDDPSRARHGAVPPGAFVLLAVGDNGCGMDKQTIEHIFEPFFTTKAIGKGTGLGLATVYGIVKQNGGFINVVSAPGQGTIFKIYLPRDPTGTADTKATKEPELVLGHGETVLLVEDDPALLSLARQLIESLGYVVVAASGPGEALRLAEEHTGEIRLLLTDVVMPEMNGRDLAHRLSLLYPQMKCLFMSGYTANTIVHHGVLDKGIHFIQKPFSVNGLAAMVREALSTE